MKKITTPRYTRIHISSPNATKIKKLHKIYNFHELILEDLLIMNNETNIDIYADMTAISLNFPKFNKKTKKYMTNTFYIIFFQETVVSISKFESKNIRMLQAKAQQGKLDAYTEDSIFDVVYGIINTMYDKVSKGLKHANQEVFGLQEKILTITNVDEQDFYDLSIKKLNMITLQHMLRPQREILIELNKSLKQIYGDNIHEEENIALYIDDLDAKLDKTINNTSILYQTIELLTNTCDSILNKKMNTYINTLTIFTVIVGILTLIVGAYGMNVSLPGQYNPYSFWRICGAMILVSGGLFWIFKKVKG